MPDAYQDGVFFHKSTRILAMPDVRESLIAFYKLLKETFPLEGMVMHHFLPSSQSLLELHFIHDGGIHFLGRFIPFSREQTMFLRAFSLTGGVNAIPNSQEVRREREQRLAGVHRKQAESASGLLPQGGGRAARPVAAHRDGGGLFYRRA